MTAYTDEDLERIRKWLADFHPLTSADGERLLATIDARDKVIAELMEYVVARCEEVACDCSDCERGRELIAKYGGTR